MDTCQTSVDSRTTVPNQRVSAADTNGAPAPPDGGWAWIVLLSVFLEQFIVIGFVGGVAVYVPVWMADLDSSAAETSLVVSLSSFLMGLLGKYW